MELAFQVAAGVFLGLFAFMTSLFFLSWWPGY